MTDWQLHRYVVCWPITDGSVPLADLIEEAMEQLPGLAEARGVALVGRRPEFYRLDDSFPPRLCADTVARIVHPERVADRQNSDADSVRRLLAAGVPPEQIRRRTLLHPAYINHVMAAAVSTASPNWATKDRRSA